jgi:ribonuclease R
MSTSVLPRRDVVVDLLGTHGRALHVNEIKSRLAVADQHATALKRLLDDLSFDGSIVALPGQRFRVSKQQIEQRGGEYQGTLTVHPRGFGFVSAAGLADDAYISPEAMRGALHGDSVIVRIVRRGNRGPEGEITEVVRRRNARVAGILRQSGKSSWLEPDDSRLRGPIVLVGQSEVRGNDGDAAVAEITRFPETPDENAEARLTAVLGVPGDPNVEVAKVLLREGIDEAHPPEAVTEAEAYGDEVDPAAFAGREDLTGVPLPTIDPEDARDHDDAVWVTRDEHGNYRAWIAIADVSHYVRPGTALDESALARGNSIYLPDRAIPMLPRALSSNLCSLLPRVIRLCLCVIIDLDATGTVTGSRIVEGFMRSAAKLTYPGVARALGFTPNPPRSEEAEAMREDLQVAWDLARLLRGKRMRRGALDFDLPEARVILDEETGAPVAVQKRSHDPGVKKAYQLIEELMLLANETVAGTMVQKNVPTVFRTHAAPDEAKLERFATLCGELGLAFDPDEAADPKKLSVFLRKIDAHPQKQVLHMLLLRAMKQATYDPANIGHFGLASSAYLHFTSPIRRYPDLAVHRATRSLLRGEPVDRSAPGLERLRVAATTANDRERNGMDVEREVVDLYRALLMRSHIGAFYEGTVTALVGSGLFVNIDDPFVDVLVRTESLGPDQYNTDDQGLRMIGARSGDRIAIGDRMMVEIEDVAILRRTVYARRVVDPDALRPRKKGKADAGDARAAGRGGDKAPRRTPKGKAPAASGSRRGGAGGGPARTSKKPAAKGNKGKKRR